MFSKIPNPLLPTKVGMKLEPKRHFTLVGVIDGEAQQLAYYEYGNCRAELWVGTNIYAAKYKTEHYSALYSLLRSAGFEFTEPVVYDPITVLLSLAREFFSVKGYVF